MPAPVAKSAKSLKTVMLAILCALVNLPHRVHTEILPKPNITVEPYPMTEGDHMTLLCISRVSASDAVVKPQFAFYRNKQTVQDFTSYSSYKVGAAQMEHSGDYTCETRTSNDSVKKTSEVLHLDIQELFPQPELKVSLAPVYEGGNLSITCSTVLNPIAENTMLQFAFYKNKEPVQTFNSSNEYEVYSVQPEHSGKYSCEVQTPNNSTKKLSQEVSVQVQGASDKSQGSYVYKPQSTLRLMLSACVLMLTACTLVHHMRTTKQQKTKNKRPSSPLVL
ncbi:hypothetical protein XELAEV_18042759mg [Xenopus laevis]|uniref:Ig-like domain-containing protein n=1 Tax=Xenopus laevis TaxID=8355 RepID=A0A974C4E3_XENLA|nr:hypothetical protein XELAEV_18042759mg [Xenopus laevis]